MTSTALRVAVLRVLADAINDQNKASRADAEAEFAALRNDSGVKSLTVALPDGTEIGTIAIKAGKQQVDYDDTAVLAFARQSAPTEITEVVDPSVLDDPKVRAFIREHKPDAITTGVTEAFKRSLKPDADGCVINRETGELVKVAEVTAGRPTGAFAYTPSKDARERVVAAWQAGELGGIGGPLAAPIAADPAPEPEPWPEPKGPAPAPPADDLPVFEAPLPVFTPGGFDEPSLFDDHITTNLGGPF